MNSSSDILPIVRRWGGASSDAALDPACKVFHIDNLEGVICYRELSDCAVVYGDPICSSVNLHRLATSFHEFCDSQNKNIIYLTATQPFVDWGMENGCGSYIEFGEELILDPFDDPKELHGENASLVRRKVRHAIKEGVVIREYHPGNYQEQQEIEEIGLSWLQSRRGPQIHTSNVHLFANELGKRWFCAEQDKRKVGVLVLNRLEAHQGWLLNHVMVKPEAAHGCPELLVTTALEAVRREGCHFVTFGPVPLKELSQVVGLGNISGWFARRVYYFARRVFHLDGRKKFWEKYHPQARPVFLLFKKPKIGLKEIKAFIEALNITL